MGVPHKETFSLSTTLPTISCIVEGKGEIEALPILIRRVAPEIDLNLYFDVQTPIRVKKNQFISNPEIREKYLRLAALKAGANGAVMVLLDADDDCPAQAAPPLLAQIAGIIPDRPFGLVLAKSEFESWFLAAAESLAGSRGLTPQLVPPPQPEAIRGAKEWLSRNMSGTRQYKETLDQPALSAIFDLHQARAASTSFDKFWRVLETFAA